MAVEVEVGEYLFFLESDEDLEDSETGAFGSAQDPTERTFLQNPLHEYESVWWVAVWFIFYCQPDGVAEEVMERARYEVYKNRFATFATGRIIQVCASLPTVLQSLCGVLVKMRNILVRAYRSFEETFDASGMLSVFQKLRKCLCALEEMSSGLDVKPPAVTRRLQEVEWFDIVGFEEGQSQRGQGADSMLGKRTRDNSTGVDRVLKR